MTPNPTIAAQIAREAEGQALLDAFYRARGYAVDRSVAGRQYDLELERDGRRVTVEEKIRSAVYNDVLVEAVQDIGSGNWGWFYSEAFDYLVYAAVVSGELRRVVIVDWPRFREWLCRVHLGGDRKPACLVSTEGYGVTVNLVIPLANIPPAYRKVFSAPLAAPQAAAANPVGQFREVACQNLTSEL